MNKTIINRLGPAGESKRAELYALIREAREKEPEVTAQRLKEMEDAKREKQEKLEATVQKVKDALVYAGPVAVLPHVYKQYSCPELELEWTVDRYWAMKLREALPKLNEIHAALKEHEHTEDNPIIFNDLDNEVYYVPNDEINIIIHTTQTTNYLYTWEQALDFGPWEVISPSLHIREFFDRFDPNNEFCQDQQKRLLEKHQDEGQSAVIKAASWLAEYADDYDDQPYPNRYSLETYKKNGFKMQYGDARDRGYIASLHHATVDNSMVNHRQIEHCVNWLDYIKDVIAEEHPTVPN